MSKVQRDGLLAVIGEAEALARVLRAVSDGRLDLAPVLAQDSPPAMITWEQSRTEAQVIAR